MLVVLSSLSLGVKAASKGSQEQQEVATYPRAELTFLGRQLEAGEEEEERRGGKLGRRWRGSSRHRDSVPVAALQGLARRQKPPWK